MKLSDLNKESNYPTRACMPCLYEAGGSPVVIEIDVYSSGKCPVCGKRRDLVNPEFFGYPVFKHPQFNVGQ
jgi:hypothetical protein